MGWLIEQKEVLVNWISSMRYGSYFINNYTYTASILFGFVILSWLVRHIYKVVFLRIARKTVTEADDRIFEATKWPLSMIVLLMGLRVAVVPLQLSERADSVLNNSVDSATIIIIALIVTSILNILIDTWGKKFTQKTESDVDDQLLNLFHKFINIFFFIIAFLFILSRWDIQIGPLLASLGIVGIAIGFAVKDSLANIFGGIQLIMDKTFKVGDKVELEDGTVGVIQDISLRSTRLRTYDNELIIIPNGKLTNENVKNHVQPDLKVRARVPFSVVYGSDPKQVKKVVLQAIKKVENIMDDPEPDVLFMEMADFSLNFRAQFWVPRFDQKFSAKIQANGLIYEALNKAKIGIPFPTRTVYNITKK